VVAQPPKHTLGYPLARSIVIFLRVGLLKDAVLMITAGLSLAQGSNAVFDLSIHSAPNPLFFQRVT
jgi:hypothetical protein